MSLLCLKGPDLVPSKDGDAGRTGEKNRGLRTISVSVLRAID